MTDNTKGQILYDATDAVVLEAEARTALAGADIVVDSEIMQAIAADDLKAIKALQQRVEEKRTAITRPLNQAIKAINDLFRAPKEYLDQAERTLKAAILDFTAEQEKIAAQARRQADEAARLERELLAEQQREQQRLARQSQESAQRAQLQAQAAAANGDAEAAALAREQARHHAAAAETAQAEADAAAQTAEVITMQVAVPAPAKLSGISGRTTYCAQVTDLMTLVQAVANGSAPLQCVCADEKFLAAQARAFRQAGPLYPGVTALAQRSLAARAA
jgi:hypothetical protein